MDKNNSSHKTSYYIQVIVILAVFFFVLFNLVFKLFIDLRSDALKRQAQQRARQKAEKQFLVKIDDHYKRLMKLYNAGEYEKAVEIIKQFNKFGKPDYKDLPAIKKKIRMVLLKRKLEFIPKIHLTEFMQLSKDIDIKQDDSTEVFIRRPRYGQYFYTSDLPIEFEGTALSVTGDFSDSIIWTSSIDGRLGKGKKIAVNLSVGEHTITATGTNGKTKGSMEIRIYIEKDPDFVKDYIRK
jgi:hypothetical protein